MTKQNLIRLMRAQLKKVQRTLNRHVYGSPKKDELEELEHEITNTLMIVEAELKHVKRG